MVSLTGMIGFTGGYEQLLGTPQTNSSGGGRLAAFAPVGLDVTGPIGCGWSIGVFFPLIDVGSLLPLSGADPQATSAGSQAARAISPLQFLAPGAYLRFGIGGTPLVFGGGASILPEAHRVELTPQTGASTTVGVPGVLVQGFLAADVTILPF